MSHAIANISRPGCPRLDRRSRNGAVIGQSCLSPIRCRLRPSLQSSADTNFPYLRGLRGAMFSYPVCRACYVNLNLPPAACCVDDLHAALKRHTSSFHPHPRSDDSACLKSPTSPLLRIPRFHQRSRDGAVIGQSCLHSPAKIVVERQSQPTGSSLLALEPRQIARKPCGRDVVHAVLPAAAYCAKDPHAALNRQTPSFQYAVALDRAPSEVTRSACLRVIAHVSLPTCHPVFSLAAFRIRSAKMLNKSFRGSNLQSVTVT
jgi:hypothetical protein